MIWVIGCNGMLGNEVVQLLNENKYPYVATDIEVDITDYSSLERFTKSIETASYFPSKLSRTERQINWIINCAGYTNVDKAEIESDKAKFVNENGALNIARISRSIGAKLIHISTDYVFDGKSQIPYTENDIKSPINIYGISKSAAEDAIQKEMNTYYIIRTSWLYSKYGKNFVKSIIEKLNTEKELKVVSDQIGTPTYSKDLAAIILRIIDRSSNATRFFGKNSIQAYGIYNYYNNGITSWYDFAVEIKKNGLKYGIIKNDCKIINCNSDEYKQNANRPAYSVLDKNKICNELKIKIPDWKVSLDKFFKN